MADEITHRPFSFEGYGVSHNQHSQANKHRKYSTRGERHLAKLGIRFKRVGLEQLRTELIKKEKGGA